MADLPTGTVTFLFTDIEGSVEMWERDAPAMQVALARHDAILKQSIEERGGYIFKTVGDAFCAAFPIASNALEATLAAQRALLGEVWKETQPLKVRMALHTGAAVERDGDYFGPSVNRVARLLSIGHGGQVLISLSTSELVRDRLRAGVGIRDLGERRLKDLFRPERVFQLTAPDLPSEFPPLRTLEVRTNNLPVQPTPLVGRDRELAEVSQRLVAPGTRLLTLTGPGGTGKTRLALQTAADLLEEFEEGTFFVPLAALTDPKLLTSAVATPLGVLEAPDRPLEEGIKDHLREKKVLLVLDNFEQILDGARLVALLLAACPDLKVLATSRIPLGIYGEREYPVPPLSLPDPERLPPLEHLTQYEAVRLFVERARDARPDFSLASENAPTVVEICARLDGLPLAIELAAARVKVLTPQKMLDKLSDRLKLLTRGASDLPERQRTLRASMEWSYMLLEEDEKALFARLSVFAGGRSLDAIEAVFDAGSGPPVDVLEGVESLVDKSLLREEDGPGGEPRFVMLETVHEYAREKLEESGEYEELKRRHAEYFLALVEEAEPELKGPRQYEWIELLEAEHDNIRAAFSWLLGAGDTESGLRLAGALRRFWHVRGYFEEGRRRLEEALAQDGRTSVSTRAKALEAVGGLAHDQGDIDRARAAALEGLEVCAGSDIGSGQVASFRRTLGITAEREGDYERATELHEGSLALYREAGNAWDIAASLFSLANVLVVREEHERARELYQEALDLSRELGDPDQYATGLANLGYEYLLDGDHEQATALNEEAARLYRERRSRGGLVYALDNLAWAALVRGDYERARALHEETLALCRELGDKLIGGECLEGLACAAAARGEAERSARLFGAARALGFEQPPAERALREPYLAEARSLLEGAAWKAAWAKGGAMTFEEAVSYALEGGAGSDSPKSGTSGEISSEQSRE